ncbi:hypothetical protein ADK91_06690, partial [Streptomyces sp. XY511]
CAHPCPATPRLPHSANGTHRTSCPTGPHGPRPAPRWSLRGGTMSAWRPPRSAPPRSTPPRSTPPRP